MEKLTFTLEGKELENVKKFQEAHRKSCVSKRNLTASEYWTYSFVPTGLGVCVSIKYNLCGTEQGCTDFDMW